MVKWKTEYIGFVAGVLSSLSTIAISSSISVDGYIPSQVALNILSTLIDINAVLLGFSGLILVYGLNSFRSTRNEALKMMHELIIEKGRLDIQKEVEKVPRDTIEKIKGSHTTSMKAIGDLIDNIDENIRGFSGFGVLVSILYIASIMLSILSLGKIETNGLYTNFLVLSLIPFFAAISLTCTAIYAIAPERRENIKGA